MSDESLTRDVWSFGGAVTALIPSEKDDRGRNGVLIGVDCRRGGRGTHPVLDEDHDRNGVLIGVFLSEGRSRTSLFNI